MELSFQMMFKYISDICITKRTTPTADLKSKDVSKIVSTIFFIVILI